MNRLQSSYDSRLTEECDISAITQLVKFKNSISEIEQNMLKSIGDVYSRQILNGAFRAEEFEAPGNSHLMRSARELGIDFGCILKSLPKAAWNYINRHRPDLVEQFESTCTSRQAILSDVIAGFFGCTV